MKRSEMIKKLREYFDECGVNLQFSNRALAINVLDEIEKIGMLPPKIDSDCYNRNEWEPENE